MAPGEVKNKKRTGRSRKLSKSDEKFLREVSSLRDRRKSSNDLAQLHRDAKLTLLQSEEA